MTSQKNLRVLLVGEYSGVHTNLKSALASTKTTVDTVSTGDGYKGFHRTYDISGGNGGKVSRTLLRLSRELLFLSRVKSYDVVQFINPLVFSRWGPVELYTRYLLSRGKARFLLAAGDDSYYWSAFRDGKYTISPHTAVLAQDLKSSHSFWESPRLKRLNNYVANSVDGIIPMAIDYEVAYRIHKNTRERINFPICLDKIPFVQMPQVGPVVIYHGVQRGKKGFKGNDLIDAALVEIARRFGSKIKIIRTESVPFAHYLQNIQAAHIVIDQVNSYCPGMAALFSMSMGRVVMSGAKTEYLQSMGLRRDQCPIINVEPNILQIESALSDILMCPHQIAERGKQSRLFVEEHYNAEKVANKFLDVWRRSL